MSTAYPLSHLFLGAGARDDGAAEATAELESMLASAVETGRRAVPAIPLDAATFVRHLGQHAGGDPDRLATIHALDLYLACAAAEGVQAAIAEIERLYLPQTRAAVARIAGSPDERDEVIQMLREKLFVRASGAEPAIASYSGRGPLGGWIRVIAVRTALGLKRAARPAEPSSSDDELLELPVMAHPELDHMRARYLPEFKAAFQEALRSLTARERNLLRLHYVDGLNIDALGALHKVHRATVARWIASARDAICERTRDRLGARLGLSDVELRGIVALVQSQVDISLLRFLEAPLDEG